MKLLKNNAEYIVLRDVSANDAEILEAIGLEKRTWVIVANGEEVWQKRIAVETRAGLLDAQVEDTGESLAISVTLTVPETEEHEELLLDVALYQVKDQKLCRPGEGPDDLVVNVWADPRNENYTNTFIFDKRTVEKSAADNVPKE